MEGLNKRLGFILEAPGKLFGRKKPNQEAPKVNQEIPQMYLWQSKLHMMEEEETLPDQRLIFLTSQLFRTGINSEEYEVLFGKIGSIYKSLVSESLEERAKAGDPNAIMELIDQANQEHIGDQSAQKAASAYYLKMGLRPLRERLVMLEGYAYVLGIDPYADTEDKD